MVNAAVGRALWFYPAGSDQPLAAIITHVIHSRLVNLSAFDITGKQFPVAEVPLVLDEDDTQFGTNEAYATWAGYSNPYNERKRVAHGFVEQLVAQGKDSYYISDQLPRLLELIFGVDPDKAECGREPDIELALAALQADAVKASAPPVDPIEQEIQAKGLTAPRITPADIQANIASEHFFTAADAIDAGIVVGYKYPSSLDLLTICVLTLQNGFTVTGESACASPENFDAEIGRKIARKNAVEKIWPLMGYELKQRLHEQRVIEPGRAEVVATWIDHNNNRIRHGVECDISKIQDSCIHLERYVNNWQENALKEHATGFQAITTEGT